MVPRPPKEKVKELKSPIRICTGPFPPLPPNLCFDSDTYDWVHDGIVNFYLMNVVSVQNYVPPPIGASKDFGTKFHVIMNNIIDITLINPYKHHIDHIYLRLYKVPNEQAGTHPNSPFSLKMEAIMNRIAPETPGLRYDMGEVNRQLQDLYGDDPFALRHDVGDMGSQVKL